MYCTKIEMSRYSIRNIDYFVIYIRKKKKIGPEDLELPWRPLYEMIDKSVFVKSRQKTLISEA